MENIYKPKNYKCTNNVPLQMYFEKFSEMLAQQPHQTDLTEDTVEYDIKNIKKNMQVNLPDNKIMELMKTCSPDELTVTGEVPKLEHTSQLYQLDFTMPSTGLDANSNCKLASFKIKKSLGQTWRFQVGTMNHNKCVADEVASTSSANDVVPNKDILVFIAIYVPFKYNYNAPKVSMMKLSQEIAVLGSQTLKDFRNKIICKNDIGIRCEVGYPRPNYPCVSAAKHYPSGFIYIDNVFYNDSLDEPNAIDYSEPIRKWAEGKNIGPFKTAWMKETRIDSLQPRFGYPYVYQHQGTCEHIIMFRDARFVAVNEILDRKSYPFYHVLQKYYAKCCCFCNNIAEWLSIGSERLPHETMFFCTNCLKSYQYINKKKIGDFKIYPYFHKAYEKF